MRGDDKLRIVQQQVAPFAQHLSTLGVEKDFNDIASKLISFGLTLNQGKLYLYLLSKREPVPARIVSMELGMHRVDTYRALRQLVGLGIIELQIGGPNRFSAKEPKLALSSLLSRFETRFSYLKGLRGDLSHSLTIFRRRNATATASQHATNYLSQISYRVVSGRESYYREVRKLVRGADKEVLRIVSALGLKLTANLEFDKEYATASERGVSIRIISDVNRENLAQAKKLSKVLDIRHLEGINARLTVVDRQITLLGHKFDSGNIPSTKEEDLNCLVLADPQFAEVSRFLFEHLWKISSRIPGLKRIPKRSRSRKFQKRIL